MAHREARAVAALVAATLLWASAFIALKLAFTELPPLWVIAGRMAVGSLVFVLAWRWRGHVEYRRGDWKWLLGMAACEPCLYFVFEAMALQHTSAAQAGMITTLLPVLVALGAFALLRERISRRMLAGFALALLGVIGLTLSGEADEHAPRAALGNFLEFLAMLCATGYTLMMKRLSTRYSAFLLTAIQAFVGVLFFLPLAWLVEPLPGEVGVTGIAAVVYLGVMVTAGAYGLYNFGVQHLPASRASGFTNLIPVFTLGFAVALLGERLSLAQLCAAGLVFLGVALSQSRPKAATPAPAGVLD